MSTVQQRFRERQKQTGTAGHLFPPMPLRDAVDKRGRLVFIAGGDIKTLTETVMNGLRE